MRKPHKYEVIRFVSFAIFLIFIAIAFTVEANQNFSDLRAVVDPRNSDPRTLVSVDPLRPWIMISKREADFIKRTGKLPTYENMEMRK